MENSKLNNVMDRFNIRNFIVNTLLLTATTAAAQEQKSAQPEADNADNLALTICAQDIAGLTIEKERTTFYNDFAPSFSARATNKRGDYAQLSGMEGLIYSNESWSAITIKFMAELGKRLGNGGTLTFKAGREATEGGNVFDNHLYYFADSNDIGLLGHASQRIAFGYEKNNQFVELGIIGSNGDGFYVIPNPKCADFWAKFGVTLLEKTGVKLDMTGAVRTGSERNLLLGSLGLRSRAYGGKIYGHYDTKQHYGNLGIRAWHDLKRGWKTIAETVINQNKDISVRGGIGKGELQFSVEYNKPRGQSAGVNFTVATNLARSHTVCGHK